MLLPSQIKTWAIGCADSAWNDVKEAGRLADVECRRFVTHHQAMQELQRSAPVCLIVPETFQEIKGLDFMQAFQQKCWPVPTILVSEFATPALVAKSMRYGAKSLLSLPLDIQELAEEFEYAIEIATSFMRCVGHRWLVQSAFARLDDHEQAAVKSMLNGVPLELEVRSKAEAAVSGVNPAVLFQKLSVSGVQELFALSLELH